MNCRWKHPFQHFGCGENPTVSDGIFNTLFTGKIVTLIFLNVNLKNTFQDSLLLGSPGCYHMSGNVILYQKYNNDSAQVRKDSALLLILGLVLIS